ncbi:MAG: rhomboid family intramembrane serine protease [Kosmotoga sp.]|nr:MAG: rhomboid family intramembrane serine protease [Kosmotoga sp.]
MFPLKDSIKSSKTPYVLYVIIVLNVVIFAYELGLSKTDLIIFIHRYGLVPSRYTDGRIIIQGTYESVNQFNLIPFLSSTFMHGGWLHIISNMWTLFVFGDNVESKLGHIRFLLYYLSWGVIANVIQFSFMSDSNIAIIGASGCIAGVMGTYLYFFPWSRVLTLVPIFFFPLLFELPAYFFLVLWFFSQFFSGVFSVSSSSSGGVAWWAHIGGFIIGLLMAWSFSRRKEETS